MNDYTPLELYKLCSNVIIKEIYNVNYLRFLSNLLQLQLPEGLNNIIIERYFIVKHISNSESN